MARLFVVCAAFTGVLLMHGLPAQGCPAGTGAPAPEVATATSGHAMTADAPSTSAGTPAPVRAGAHDTPGSGTSCVSTPARWDSAGSPGHGPVIERAGTGAGPTPGFGGPVDSNRRAPPLAGACLLTALGVSRT